MIMEYKQYKHPDFLVDDFFVESMLRPTLESEKFWKDKIDTQEIDIDEFITAYMFIKDINTLQSRVSDEDVTSVWEKIELWNGLKKKRKKYFRILRYFGYAAAFAGIILSVFVDHDKKEIVYKNSSIEDFALSNANIKTTQNDLIRISNSEKTIDIEGNEANVQYDKNGNMILGQKSVSATKNSSPASTTYNQINVPFGKRANLTLSDGTLLWINTGTRVIYPSSFSNDKREIYVEGEVYAEVTHDAKRPFIIKTTKLDIKVFGTVFNLSAYAEDKQVNVVLVSGSIGATPKKGKTTFVKPNQLLSYSDQAVTLRTVKVDNYISWKDGLYAFENEPIENVLLKLSKFYNVTIKLPETASGITCSGKLELKEDINNLLNGLSDITPMSYIENNKTYKILFR